jgi:hypothetical protein
VLIYVARHKTLTYCNEHLPIIAPVIKNALLLSIVLHIDKLVDLISIGATITLNLNIDDHMGVSRAGLEELIVQYNRLSIFDSD